MDKESILDIIAEAHKILILKQNWSEEPFCTKKGIECDPLDADAWSVLGSLEKVLLDKSQYTLLPTVVSELEKDCDVPLCLFEEEHCHREVMELLYTTMGRLADDLNYNMYAPLFPIIEDEFNPDEDISVLFIPKEFDEALEKADKEIEERMEEARKRDHELLSFYRDDE